MGCSRHEPVGLLLQPSNQHCPPFLFGKRRVLKRALLGAGDAEEKCLSLLLGQLPGRLFQKVPERRRKLPDQRFNSVTVCTGRPALCVFLRTRPGRALRPFPRRLARGRAKTVRQVAGLNDPQIEAHVLVSVSLRELVGVSPAEGTPTSYRPAGCLSPNLRTGTSRSMHFLQRRFFNRQEDPGQLESS